MRAFVFVSCFVALAIARPEAGYSYNAPPAQAPAPSYSQAPQTSYQQQPSGSQYSDSSVVGASYSVGGSEQSYSSGGSSASYTSGGSYDSGSQYVDTGANYNSGSFSGSSIGSGSSFVGGPSFDTGASFGGASGSGFGGGASGSGFGGGAAAGGATTVIQKHIYVHVPPPEPEQQQAQHGGAGGVVNQKHYKIIFIKAPSAPSYSASQLAAQQAASQEKTIVYVLVKKPEEHIDAAGNTVAGPPVVPSKPEVYFIKYKTQGGGSSGGSSGGQIGSGSGIVGSHDAVSGVSFDHSSSHAQGQPAAAYGPPH